MILPVKYGTRACPSAAAAPVKHESHQQGCDRHCRFRHRSVYDL